MQGRMSEDSDSAFGHVYARRLMTWLRKKGDSDDVPASHEVCLLSKIYTCPPIEGVARVLAAADRRVYASWRCDQRE